MRPNRGSFFNDLYNKMNKTLLRGSDPILNAHRYSDSRDQEIAAFISACFAYGSVKPMNKALLTILEPLGSSPYNAIKFSDNFEYLKGFYYRFHRSEHVIILLKTIQKILQVFDTFEKYAFQFYQNGNLELFLNEFSNDLRLRLLSDVKSNPSLERGLKFFVNSPQDGSACKRMNMFLRWMSRKDEIDLGLWKWLNPKNLIIPVDTHISHISYFLELRKGKLDRSPNWKMALEITDSLRKMNPDDPISYDFALTRLGILKLCKKKYIKNICIECALNPICKFSLRKK